MIVLHLSHEEKLAIILIALILLFLSLILSICLASPLCLLNNWLDERLRQRKIRARQQQQQNQLLATQATIATQVTRQALVSNDFSTPKTLTVANSNNDADNISIIIRAQNQAPPSYDKAVQLDCGTANSMRHYNENIQLAGTVHYHVDKRLAGSGGHNNPLLCNIGDKPAIKKQLIDPANYADYFHQPESNACAAPAELPPMPIVELPTPQTDGIISRSPLQATKATNFRLAIPLIVAPLCGTDQAEADLQGAGQQQLVAGSTSSNVSKIGPILMRFWLDVLDEADDTIDHQRLQDNDNAECPVHGKLTGAPATSAAGIVSAAVSLEDLSSLSSGQSSQSSNCSNCSNKEHGIEVGHSVVVSDDKQSIINDSVICKGGGNNTSNMNYSGVYGVNIAGYTINSTTTTTTTASSLTLCMPKIGTRDDNQQQQTSKDNNGTKKVKRQQMIRFKVSICDIENLTQQHLHNYLTSVNNTSNGNHINNYSNHTSFMSSHIYVQCDLMAPTKSRYLRPMIPMSSKMRDARPVVTFRTVSQRLLKLEDHHVAGNQSFHSSSASGAGAANQRTPMAPITLCPIYQPINATFVTPKLTNSLLSEGYIRMRIFIENKHVNDVCVAQLKLPISSVMKGTQQQQQHQQQQQQQTVTSISSSMISPDSSSSGCSSMTLQVEPFEQQQHNHLALSYECEMLHEIKGQALLGLSYLPTSNRVIINAYRASIDDTDKELKKLLLQTGNSYFLRFMMMINGRVIKKKRTPVVTRQNLTGQQQTKLFWDSQESITFDLVNINVDQPDFVVVLILRQQQQKQQQQQPQQQQPEQSSELDDSSTANNQPQNIISANPIASTASNFAKRFMMLSSYNSNNNNDNNQTSNAADSQLRSSASVGNIRQAHNIQQGQCHSDNDSHMLANNVNRASFYNSEPEHLSLKRYLSSENNDLEMSAGAYGGQAKRRRDLVIGHVVLGETIWQEMKSQPRRQIKREFLLY